MTWIPLATVTARQDWQFSPVIAANLSYVRLSFSTAGVPVWIAQADPDSTDIYDERRIVATPHARILEFEAPPFFNDRALALRVPNTNPFDIQIEVSSMPISPPPSSSGNAPSSSVVTPTTVNASTASVQLLAANSNRKGFSIINNSSATLFIDLDGEASATNYAVALGQGFMYECPINYTGVVSGIWTAANGNALVREFA